MFFVKQLLGALIMPLPVILLLLTAGALLLWLTARHTLGRILVTAATALLFLASFPPLTERFVAPLESRHPHILDARFLGEDIRWIVVLGGGVRPDPGVQPHVRLTEETLFRVVEGIRLHRELSRTRMLFTGWGGRSEVSTAEANAEVARSFGVPESAIEVDPRPRDTEEEAEAVRERIRPGEPFLLVTSAAHLPRALRLFRARGLDPIPAPAHRYSLPTARGFRGHFPSAEGLRMTERTIHEHAGTLWTRVR